MLPLKKILCPTDFSEPALAALNAAGEMAFHFSVPLLVVNIVPPIPVPTRPIAASSLPEPGYSPGFDLSSYLLELTNAAREDLQNLVQEHVPPEVMVHLAVSSGPADQEIIKIAKQAQADLIVIATHGQRGWHHFFFGSVAEKVVRLAAIPVLVIHPPQEI